MCHVSHNCLRLFKIHICISYLQIHIYIYIDLLFLFVVISQLIKVSQSSNEGDNNNK